MYGNGKSKGNGTVTIFACRRSGSHADIFFPKEEKTRRRSSVFSKISGYRQNKKVRLFCVLFLGQTELHFASFTLFHSLFQFGESPWLWLSWFLTYCLPILCFSVVLLMFFFPRFPRYFLNPSLSWFSVLCSLSKHIFRLWFPSHNNKFILKASLWLWHCISVIVSSECIHLLTVLLTYKYC